MAVLQLSGILKPKVSKNNCSILYRGNDVLKDMSKDAEKDSYENETKSNWG